MGEEVAAVLRTAHEQVAALRIKADEEAAEHRRALEAQADLARVEAEKYSADLRANAEAWADEVATREAEQWEPPEAWKQEDRNAAAKRRR